MRVGNIPPVKSASRSKLQARSTSGYRQGSEEKQNVPSSNASGVTEQETVRKRGGAFIAMNHSIIAINVNDKKKTLQKV